MLIWLFINSIFRSIFCNKNNRYRYRLEICDAYESWPAITCSDIMHLIFFCGSASHPHLYWKHFFYLRLMLDTNKGCCSLSDWNYCCDIQRFNMHSLSQCFLVAKEVNPLFKKAKKYLIYVLT